MNANAAITSWYWAALLGAASAYPVHAAEPPNADVYVYPAKGQSPEQLDRDRYECYLWAVRESGFDPSRPGVPPPQRVRVVEARGSGNRVVAGAVTGAVVGAAVSRPRDSGTGAAVGAVVGAIAGAAADSAERDAARKVQEARQRREADRAASLQAQADSYRRAVSACLVGRGYTVN
jgi:hypothetical protein